MPQVVDVCEGWDVQVCDCTVFVRFKGVDVVAVWLPFDDPDSKPSVTIPDAGQFRGWETHAEEYVRDRPFTEWAQAGEVDICIQDRVDCIDAALIAISREARRVEARQDLNRMRALGEHSDQEWREAVFRFMSEYGYLE